MKCIQLDFLPGLCSSRMNVELCFLMKNKFSFGKQLCLLSSLPMIFRLFENGKWPTTEDKSL